MQLEDNTLTKLKQFEYLFQHGHKSDLIRETLSKLAEIELFEFKKNLLEIQNKISLFEKQYNMTSETFSEKFDAGELGDSANFIEWFAYTDMRDELLKKIEILDKSDA
ncbi:hypothetical protein [Desulfonema magnum]|uniref:Uncharacterized protein n=1 Tax=Desulfonema magnum TaxID=45655 RepID=A0A975BT66_9BACT|nr:hypothetical protein [Desulfonema magnum]QTA90948.1 Uncharacterized protein dnm_070120 [Desulfonema magnum]